MHAPLCASTDFSRRPFFATILKVPGVVLNNSSLSKEFLAWKIRRFVGLTIRRVAADVIWVTLSHIALCVELVKGTYVRSGFGGSKQNGGGHLIFVAYSYAQSVPTR
jgi:hypothetical protein